MSPTGDFPLIKAVMYFDAPGNDGNDYVPAGLGRDGSCSKACPRAAVFQPVTIDLDASRPRASPASTIVGHRVRLNAQVSNTDFGGSVSFDANGSAVARDVSPFRLAAGDVVLTTACFRANQLRSRRSTAATPKSQGPRQPTASTVSLGPRSVPAASGSGFDFRCGPGSRFVSHSHVCVRSRSSGLPDFGGLVASSGGARHEPGRSLRSRLTLGLPDFRQPVQQGGGSESRIRSNGPRPSCAAVPAPRRFWSPAAAVILLLLVDLHGVHVDTGPREGPSESCPLWPAMPHPIEQPRSSKPEFTTPEEQVHLP